MPLHAALLLKPDCRLCSSTYYTSYFVASGLATILGTWHNKPMRIIAVSTLRECWEQKPDAEHPLRAWHEIASAEVWQTPQDIKDKYSNASIVANNRVVFNIKGNDFRLIVKIHYNTGIVYIRFVGTHREYDAVDAETI